MKKTYSKPDIVFEDFSLSTSIAAGCEFKANHNDGDCGFKFGGYLVFLDGICKDNPVLDGWNGICYHNPSDDKNVFTS